MSYVAPALFLILATGSLYALAVAMYGDFRAFLEAWKEWGRGIVSPEVLIGGAFPPLRLAYWLLLAVVVVCGEGGLILGG
jgi:hypothetical protein